MYKVKGIINGDYVTIDVYSIESRSMYFDVKLLLSSGIIIICELITIVT